MTARPSLPRAAPATAAGTAPRALRFYEERGLLPPPTRSTTGQRRQYSARDAARVGFIRELLSLGLTVEDLSHCADRLDLLMDDPPQRCGASGTGGTESPGVAARRPAVLDAEIARLTRLREQLASRVGVDARPSADATGIHWLGRPPRT